MKKIGDTTISISNGKFMLLKFKKQNKSKNPNTHDEKNLKQTKQTLPTTFLTSFLVDGVYPQR